MVTRKMKTLPNSDAIAKDSILFNLKAFEVGASYAEKIIRHIELYVMWQCRLL